MRKLLWILPLLLLITLPHLVYAQISPTDTVSPTATTTPTQATLDYTMPYPGLLPDNPLYSLKVFRDRVISFFISDPLKRSSFDLLQADKRLEGAYYLQKKGLSAGRQGKQYDSLVGTTTSKAENYFDEAIQQIKQAKSMGEDINPQLGTLRAADQKHTQLITQMMPSASSSLQQNLQQQMKRLSDFDKMLSALSKE